MHIEADGVGVITRNRCELTPVRSLKGLTARINGRGIYLADINVIEIARPVSLDKPDKFVLSELPIEEVARAYLSSDYQPDGERSSTVAFCFDPETGVGKLAEIK